MKSEDRTMKEAWRRLSPAGIEIAWGPITHMLPALTKRESESAGEVTTARTLELKAGRYFAKQALAGFGIKDVELPIGPDRSPVWPKGVTGSITHVRDRDFGYCAAAVGLTAQFSSVGIDMEYRRDLPLEVWQTFLTSNELDQIEKLNEGDQQENALCRWCVKESVIKALRLGLDPLAIQTETTNIRGNWRVFRLDTDRFGSLGHGWSARSAQADGFVLAVVALRQLDRPLNT
jgi:4'-phosphopantetheinyl transferase EntD